MQHFLMAPFHRLQASYAVPSGFSLCWVRPTVNKLRKWSIKVIKHIFGFYWTTGKITFSIYFRFIFFLFKPLRLLLLFFFFFFNFTIKWNLTCILVNREKSIPPWVAPLSYFYYIVCYFCFSSSNFIIKLNV